MPTGATVAARAASRLYGVLPVAALFVCGCTGASPGDRPTQLSVLAASSLTEAFRALETAFEETHPDVDVVLTFSGSQVLRMQIEQGASADVFASANEVHARALTDAGLADPPALLAHNRLALVVPIDNPAGISSFAELPLVRRLVVGTESVPIGIYTRAMLARADARFGPDFSRRVRDRVVSEESNVRLIRAKVELGEADAAIVYRTDAVASDQVGVIDIPDDVNVSAVYVIAAVRGDEPSSGESRSATLDFLAFVRSEQGQAILAGLGFDVEGS